jgi:dephospho-CoA kinase
LIPVIGLTGTIGGGKSRVAALLGRRGAVVIDADAVGHEVLARGDIVRRVVERFGTAVLEASGVLDHPRVDRKLLGRLVFADPAARHDLEAIVHPEMRRRFEQAIEHERARAKAPAIVLDAAILLEAGWDSLCDLVVFVDASLPVRLDRVLRDRGWTEAVLRARDSAQWPSEVKRERANITIRNDASLESLEQNVDLLFSMVTGGPALDLPPEGSGSRFVGDSYGPVPIAPGDAR